LISAILRLLTIAIQGYALFAIGFTINKREVMQMKKFIAIATATLMLTMPVMAEESVQVFSNGNEVADRGVIVDGRTMVPVRGVFEYMGYSVDWNSDTKTATLTNSKKNITIVLTSGNTFFTVNGDEVTPDVPQQIINDRFMLPLRAVGEAVNAKVGWNEDTKTATLNEQNNYFTINGVDKDSDILNTAPINNITIE
jgi:hypothetical protein